MYQDVQAHVQHCERNKASNMFAKIVYALAMQGESVVTCDPCRIRDYSKGGFATVRGETRHTGTF